MWPAWRSRSAAAGCLPLTPNYVAREVWSGCAQRWWFHKVHTVQTLLCAPRPTPSTHVFGCPPTPPHPHAPPVLSFTFLSQGQFEVTPGGVLEALRSVWRPSFTANMVHSGSFCRFLLLVLLGLTVAFVHTGKPPPFLCAVGIAGSFFCFFSFK